MKNKLGVTLTVLVITIVVMFILFGITFSTATDLLKNTQKNKMKTMLYMVKSRAEILLDDYLFDYDNENSDTKSANLLGVTNPGEKLGGSYVTDIKKLQAVGFLVGSTEVPTKDTVVYCSWDENTLKSQGIDTKNLAKGDTIIVQYNLVEGKVEVASTKGYSNEGVGIHKLSEFEN